MKKKKVLTFQAVFTIVLFLQWGAFYLFIADFFATQIIGGA